MQGPAEVERDSKGPRGQRALEQEEGLAGASLMLKAFYRGNVSSTHSGFFLILSTKSFMSSSKTH